MSFAVVGSGIIGLTTALEVKKEYPNAKVSILSDKFGVDTTSDVAAGLFRPAKTFAGPSPEVTAKWMRDSYEYWDAIRQSEYSAHAGVCQLSGYIFSRIDNKLVENPHMSNVVHTYRPVTEEELDLCNGGWKYGSFFTTVLTDCNRFLPFALEKFTSMGGIVIKTKVHSFEELSQNYDVILNCTGLAARELCSDRNLIPMRGQIVKVDAPWIKMAFYGDNDTYIIPGFSSVTLGGTYQKGNFNTTPCPLMSKDIRSRCYSMLPSLKKSKFLYDRVGLRPYRDVVRVEPEVFDSSTGKKIKVVHNYGHGGYGVTTAPGTAKHATKLLKEVYSATYISKL